MEFGFSLLGTGQSTKKEEMLTYSPTVNAHQPFEQFAYSPQIDWSYAPTVVNNSAGANVTGATVTTKKESAVAQEGGDTTGATTEGTLGMTENKDLLIPLLIIGAVGIGGYMLLKSKKKKFKK